MNPMTYDEWAAIGLVNGWLGVRANDPKTSKAGAKAAVLTARSHRYKLLVCYQAADLTDSEAGQASGLAQTGSGYWKRCSELRQAGYIATTGVSRPSSAGVDQQVCAITQAGHDLLSSLS